jgi:hypothetical protein
MRHREQRVSDVCLVVSYSYSLMQGSCTAALRVFLSASVSL